MKAYLEYLDKQEENAKKMHKGKSLNLTNYKLTKYITTEENCKKFKAKYLELQKENREGFQKELEDILHETHIPDLVAGGAAKLAKEITDYFIKVGKI